MQTVVETAAYLASAKAAGLSNDDRRRVVDVIADSPTLGDIIQGTGGCRKVRFGLANRGKSGGIRVITFFAASDVPVFLLAVFAKNERSDLSQAERNELAILTRRLAATYQKRNAP